VLPVCIYAQIKLKILNKYLLFWVVVELQKAAMVELVTLSVPEHNDVRFQLVVYIEFSKTDEVVVVEVRKSTEIPKRNFRY